MCGGDDHLAWKHSISLEIQLRFHSYMWVHLWTFRDALVTIGFDYSLCSLLLVVSNQSDQRSDQRNMDSQIVTVDQFAKVMASIQEALASLGQRIDGQQAQ
ncbi:hypothetical protein AAG906_018873 [Vitis piasezkii]